MNYTIAEDAQLAIACRGTRAVISLNAIRNNVRVAIERSRGAMVAAVVKADAYGHGAAHVARAALDAGASWLAVASPVEAVELRRCGISAPILVLAGLFPASAATVVEYGIAQAVCDHSLAKAISAEAAHCGKVAELHIKFDSGMGRMGLTSIESTVALARQIAELPNVRIGGVFSHFASSDSSDTSYAQSQLERWRSLLEAFERAGIDPGIRHIANSAATLALPASHFDMVRFGISLYGLQPSDEVSDTSLMPAMTFMTNVVLIKDVPAGGSLSYGMTFTTTRQSRIAIIPAGYADGYMRLLSNRGAVMIRGQRAPVVGRVCMDMTLVDITDIPTATTGDDAVLFGPWKGSGIPAEEVASSIGTINYELTCAVSRRVPRVYCD